MTIQYKWDWGPMSVQTIDNELTNIIVGINWKCTATEIETDVITSETGYLQLPPPNPNDFIDLDNVTPAIINSWIENYMDKAPVEASCADYINSLSTPMIRVLPLPE